MYKFTNSDYISIAEKVTNQVKSTSITKLNIEIENDEVDINLSAMIVPKMKCERLPEANIEVLAEIVPIWWDVKTTSLDGQQINDFDLKTLNNYINQW